MLKKIFRLFFRRKKRSNLNIRYYGEKIPQLDLSETSYANEVKVYCWSDKIKLTIGKYCSLAEDIQFICGGEHDSDWVSTFPFFKRFKQEENYHLNRPRFKGNITIGNDVWIGQRATVLSGVTLPDGCIVAAGAVVVSSPPPYSIVGGVPAKVIRKRFSDEIIEKLQKIRWWDWDEETILQRTTEFMDVEKFCEKYYKE